MCHKQQFLHFFHFIFIYIYKYSFFFASFSLSLGQRRVGVAVWHTMHDIIVVVFATFYTHS